MHRKGITPVIAILLLLMMTVAAAGGAYVWISTLQEQLQSQASEQIETSLNRDIEIVEIQCGGESSTPSWVNAVLRNSGDTELDLDSVDVRVREASGGDLITFETYDFTAAGTPIESGTDFSEPGASAEYNITTWPSDSENWASGGGSFRIQFVFADEGNIQQEGRCDV